MSWLKARDWATGVEYSKLFHSGLRAISLRPWAPRGRSTLAAPGDDVRKRGQLSLSSLSTNILKRRSMAPKKPGQHPANPDSQRRKVVRPRPSSMMVLPTKQIFDLWYPEEGELEIEEYKKFLVEEHMTPPLVELTDALPSLPGSRPVYVTLGDPILAPTKEESFLSLAQSSDLPRRPFPSQNRHLSVQSSPPSRRSSLHFHSSRGDELSRIDGAWMLEESSPELPAREWGTDEDVSDLSLDLDSSDWRQFHVDWLSDIPSIHQHAR